MTCRIGVDEAGKGDYFGYLVVAAVFVGDDEQKLKALGAKDSKLLSDYAISKMAPKIKKLCGHDVVKISPEKYNVLYKKFGSLNKLLAWGHARAIENLLSKVQCDLVITDKFGEESFLEEALMEKGKKARIEQKVHGESDVAVAAASIIARHEFLKTLRALGREVGSVLPKGATHVEEAAKELVKKHGEDVLSYVAKLHFKTTKRVLKR